MKKTRSVEDYIAKADNWQDEITKLIDLLRRTDLKECVKWGAPCYTYDGQNVVGVLAFKNYFGLWFHQGVLLEDKAGVLMNAQEGKTKALRQWRMISADEIKPAVILSYVNEAIQLVKDGKKVPIARKKPLVMPPELKTALSGDNAVKAAFDTLTPGNQREYADYISEAKQAATKQRRLDKILPMIIEGVGLNDKYR